MIKPPAFQFYADDFLAGTFSMSNEERGLYITLLCRQWTQGHVTQDEVSRLGSTVVQPSINHVLTKFEKDDQGNLKNSRLEAERAKQDAFRAKQSQKGKASAVARFNRGSTVVQPNGEQDGNSPSPSPSPINTSSRPESATPTQDGVDSFSKTFPHPNSEAEKFVDWFLALLSETGAPKPVLTKPNRYSWADAYDKMIRLDGREKEQIKAVCRWARQDKFWAGNFMAPPKLRDKKDGVMYFDQFLNKIGDGNRQQAVRVQT